MLSPIRFSPYVLSPLSNSSTLYVDEKLNWFATKMCVCDRASEIVCVSCVSKHEKEHKLLTNTKAAAVLVKTCQKGFNDETGVGERKGTGTARAIDI